MERVIPPIPPPPVFSTPAIILHLVLLGLAMASVIGLFVKLRRPARVSDGFLSLAVIIGATVLCLFGVRQGENHHAPFLLGYMFFVWAVAGLALLISIVRLSKKGEAAAILELLGSLVALGLLIVLMLPAVPRAGPAARLSDCGNNLRQLGLAMHNYHDQYGSFPPAYVTGEDGSPMHSWRVLLLPYLEQAPLYDQYCFDEPWDGPNNILLQDKIGRHPYRCPADGEGGDPMTSYVAVVGPRTVWPGSEPVTLADIPDGTSNTILIVEVRDSGIHWMEPRDLQFETMSFAVNDPDDLSISSEHRLRVRGDWFWQPHRLLVNVVMANGAPYRLAEDIDTETLQALLKVDGGIDLDQRWPQQ